MQLYTAEVGQILTRATGFLKTVTSHSLQPYRGCGFGRSLCGAGCYVQHNRWLTRGEPWGSFVEARINASEVYRAQYSRERAWGRSARGEFGIFLSSSTEPFQPAEQRYHITGSLLAAMVQLPPDALIIQTHSHRVRDYVDVYRQLNRRTALRFHVSVETDREQLPGLPPPASSVEKRLAAASALKASGFYVVITMAPLLPLADPVGFFKRLTSVADAVVFDHFIGGDGSADGARTRRTGLPRAMEQVAPESTSLNYRDRMVELAREHFQGQVGISIDGFAGRMLSGL